MYHSLALDYLKDQLYAWCFALPFFLLVCQYKHILQSAYGCDDCLMCEEVALSTCSFAIQVQLYLHAVVFVTRLSINTCLGHIFISIDSPLIHSIHTVLNVHHDYNFEKIFQGLWSGKVLITVYGFSIPMLFVRVQNSMFICKKL